MRTALTSWLLPIISIAVVVALSAGLIYPWAKDSFNKRKEISEKRNQLEQILEPKLELLQKLNKEVLQTQLAELELILPSSTQAPFIFASIENLAVENEVFVEGLSFAVAQKAKTKSGETPIEAIQLNFIAKGQSDSLVNFVDKLEQTAPLFGVDSYLQSENENEPDTLSLAISSFYKTLPQEIGGTKEPLEVWGKKELEALTKLEEFGVAVVNLETKEQIEQIPLGKTNTF